jgi:hypothetical protein
VAPDPDDCDGVTASVHRIAVALTAVALRWRWAIGASAVAFAAVLARGDQTPDLLSFSQRGQLILTGHLSAVYAGSWNQAGPVQLLVARLLLLGTSSEQPTFAMELAVDAALLLALARVVGRSGASPGRELALAGAAAVWMGPSGLWSGHPVEVLVPLLWIRAGALAIRGRWIAGGAAIGLAALVAPWAFLALPVTFARRSGAVRAIGAVGTAALVTGVGYLPFVLSGRFDLFAQTWAIGRSTLVHLVAPHLVHFTWPERLIQAAFAAGGCWLVVRSHRAGTNRAGSNHVRSSVIWAAPLAAALLRVLLDPMTLHYYWLPIGFLVIAGAALRAPMSRREGSVLGALLYLSYAGSTGVALIGCVAGCLTLTVALLLLERSDSDLDPRVGRVERGTGMQRRRAPLTADVDLVPSGGEVVRGDRLAIAAPDVGESYARSKGL